MKRARPTIRVVTALAIGAALITFLVLRAAREDAPPPGHWAPQAAPSGSASPLTIELLELDTDAVEPDVDMLTIEQVALGSEQRCVVMSNRTVRCWGWHEWNALGKSGLARKRAPVRGLRDVVRVSLGYRHGCALIADGSVRCWGSNLMGHLGEGTGADATTPVPVLGLRSVTQLAVGLHHTCVRLEDRSVRCWGQNEASQLGVGGATTFVAFDSRAVPRPVPGLPPVDEIAPGDVHTCARAVDARIFCWGDARRGTLGFESATEISPHPTEVVGLRDVVQLASAPEHACARMADGSVACWGRNTLGELGDGTQVAKIRPTLIEGFRGATDLHVTDGRTCALMKGGAVRCAGLVQHASSKVASTPVAIQGIKDVKELALGNGACVVTTGHEVACWGYEAATNRFSW